MLADLESLEKRVVNLEKRAKAGDKESAQTLRLVQPGARPSSTPAARPAGAEVAAEDDKAWRMLQLLTSKPALYVCQRRRGLGRRPATRCRRRSPSAPPRDGANAVVISAQIESEIAMLDPAERAEFLETLGLDEPGLNRLIREAYDLLGLQTYFTVGPKEARAWTIPRATPPRRRPA